LNAGLIISFEPIPADADQICRFAKGDPKWLVQNIALGDRDCEATLNLQFCGNETVLSSFLKSTSGTTTQPIKVPMRRFDTLLPTLIPSAERLFLKMDTQGYDLNVFKGTGKYLEKIVGLQSELSVIPLYENMPHYTTALSTFENAGFSLMDMFVVCRDSKNRIIEYDCIMAR
jgi:FkbM family methyltransferase